MDRRDFLKAAAAISLAATVTLPAVTIARADDFWSLPRELWLRHSDTHEAVKTIYWENGNYNEDGYKKLSMLLRDYHENSAVWMDVKLLDTLRGIYGWLNRMGYNEPLVVNSGFRTEKTNNKLKKEGSAKNSMHLYGKAADIWVPGLNTKTLAGMLFYFKTGGVGLYKGKQFVHADTGRIRQWAG